MNPPPWLLISGDFTPLGGMDRANYALATYLARREGAEVHLVTHRAWADLEGHPRIHVHRAARPKGSHLLGIPFLASKGRHWARKVSDRGGRVLVNGGNCQWGDVNWVHYVHASWASHPPRAAGPLRRFKAALHSAQSLRAERHALFNARVIITNSNRTRDDVISHFDLPAERVHTIYYGSDPNQFIRIEPEERALAKAHLGWPQDQPVIAFVGALGDHRKGFDNLFEAWKRLVSDPNWSARLVVAGSGSTLPQWQARASEEGLGQSIEFLGFRDDMPRVLAGCDLLVSPTRYEAYGLNVQEALCRGLPAIVSASAGVAERYPGSLKALLLPDPDDWVDLADRIRSWSMNRERIQLEVAPLGQMLRERTWDDCASEIVGLVERGS